MEKGEEILYNYGVDGVEALFGQQECRCGARNCSGYIGKKAVGSGLAPLEEWLERAPHALETKNTSLEIIETLVKEAPETNTCPLYLELKEKSDAVRAWLRRYYEMMKGWIESQEEKAERLEKEKKKEEEDKKRREEERKKKAAAKARAKAEAKRAEKSKEEGGKKGSKGKGKAKPKKKGSTAAVETDVKKEEGDLSPAAAAAAAVGDELAAAVAQDGQPKEEEKEEAPAKVSEQRACRYSKAKANAHLFLFFPFLPLSPACCCS